MTVGEVRWHPNDLKGRLAVAGRAVQDLEDVWSPVRNPLGRWAHAVSEGAWVSPLAGPMVAELTSVGLALAGEVDLAADRLADELAGEPDEVEVPGPQAWKAGLDGAAGPGRVMV